MSRLRTVHIRARLPYMYIGIDMSMKKSWIPPIDRNTVREPSASSQSTMKREKTNPWRISGRKKDVRSDKTNKRMKDSSTYSC